MIEDLWTFFLHGISRELDPETKIFHTVFVPRRDVTATVSLSLLTFGADVGLRRMGWAGAVVKKGAFADASNRAQNIPVATSFDRNALRINRCVFVTFQLSVALGEAIAQCNVFFHGSGGERSVEAEEGVRTRQAVVHDRKTGKALTVHALTAFPGVREPSERLLATKVRSCAAEELGVASRELGVHFHEAEALRFHPGLVVDTQSGRLAGAADEVGWRRT